MGIQSLQDYVDSCGSFSTQLVKHLDEESSKKTSNLLLVHADSCLRHFYHENIDWVCGGQWSELYQCVEKFVRAFRQSDIELIVFFDGSINEISLKRWASSHGITREVVKETLSHIIHNQNIPFRTKMKNFVAPGAFKSALRLAFRACEVLVCSSIEDIFKETMLYAKDMNCLGILGSDANYFFYNATNYMSLGNSRWIKKTLSACKIYDKEAILKELALTNDDLPYLAALLGNFAVNDSLLSSFYWSLIEDDNPLKKVKENLASDVVLPPSEVRLKCVAKFLSEHRDKVKDVKNLAEIVFAENDAVPCEEGADKLKMVIDFYQDCLLVSNSAVCSMKDEVNQVSKSGFPLPTSLSNLTGSKSKYKKCWTLYEKPKQMSQQQPSSQLTSKDNINIAETEIETIKNPEQVLKEGTLEEAAQALEQLELKESAAGAVDQEVSVVDQEAAESVTKSDDEEKEPEQEAVKEPVNEEADSISDVVVPEPPCVEYSREVKVVPVIDSISEDVLGVVLKRHQSGQMCPEVLNLLTKGEVVMNMTLDDELVSSRLPIPLIYRTLRQLVYGVLFGAKCDLEDDAKVKVNGVVDTEKETCADHEDKETEDNKTEEKEIEDNKTEEKETEDNKTEEKETEEKEAEDKETEEKEAEGKIAIIETEQPIENKRDDSDVFLVKEWCIYGDRKLDTPDLVQAKAMSWGVPSLKKLWFGTDSEDNANRLKAFLSCMKSDTVNMSNTAMVPQRLMLLCCVLRYLVQQDEGKSVLTKQDIDAFLAHALSPQLTTEHNTQNLANMKLNQMDARCVQLAAIFMSGIENAIIANDACGSPVPWEFCCPWNYFDGKLFHSKWLQATMNFSTIDLCEGKPHIAEKLERLRWCITEGLEAKYTITGLQQNRKFFSPFGNVPQMQDRPMQHGVMRSDGPGNMRPRSRGMNSKRAVHGSGGTLHVAGVPVAHWGGNKSGFGYTRNGPGVLVGGPESIDLPSNYRRTRGGRGIRGNRGRGLLATPFLSPWQQGLGFEDYVVSTYERYLRDVQKVEQMQSKVSKLTRPLVYTNRNRYQNQGAKSHGRNNLWVGKGRGSATSVVPPSKPTSSTEQSYGRGHWVTNGE